MRSRHDINAAVRRRPRDWVDIDVYRTDITALRGHRICDAHALRIVTTGALVLAGVLGFAVVVPAAMSHGCDRHAVEICNSSQAN